MALKPPSLLLAAFCVFCGTTVIAADIHSGTTIAFAAEHEGGLHIVEVSSGKISELNVGVFRVFDDETAMGKPEYAVILNV